MFDVVLHTYQLGKTNKNISSAQTCICFNEWKCPLVRGRNAIKNACYEKLPCKETVNFRKNNNSYKYKKKRKTILSFVKVCSFFHVKTNVKVTTKKQRKIMSSQRYNNFEIGRSSRAVFPNLFWFAAPLLSCVGIWRHP